jgi:ABC-type bacteriocin/lantibiotic exporter with double-glycine peptidase domain
MLTAAQKMGLKIRVDLLRHLGSLSADYYERTPVGHAMYAFQGPVDEISFFGSDLLASILRSALTICFSLSTMSMLSPFLTITILPFVPAFLLIRGHFRNRLTVASDRVQSNQLAWSALLEEHLSALMPIQLLGQERRQARKAFQLLGRAVKSQHNLFRTAFRFSMCTSVTIILAISTVISCGGRDVIAGALSVGSLVAFYTLVSQLFDPLSGAAELYARAQKAFASVRQVRAIFSESPAVLESVAAMPLRCEHPDIEFTRVEFGYRRQANMLSIPSLRIRAGEDVAVVGENGCGKSTMMKLISRVYDADSGSVRIGQEDVRNICLSSLRRAICYLSRDPVLFAGSLASNLRFVRVGASDKELREAICHAGLSAFVATLSQGLQQNIGTGGCQLSGGQRQRLAIARALLQRPQILILDEATSCLDPLSEEAILDDLRKALNTATLIVVSHRVATISRFSRILTMANGKIVEDGGVSTFFSTPTVYRNLSSLSTLEPQD